MTHDEPTTPRDPGDSEPRTPAAPPDPSQRLGGEELARAHDDDMGHHFDHAREVVRDAAIQAEMDTGHREETIEEAESSAMRRIARAIGGFVVIGVGIALLPLPGPGWVIIIIGLSMLPFAWAERTILLIRRRIPGIPDEGKIPLSTWIIMGVMVVGASLIAIFFGRAIAGWLGDLWSGLWD